MALRYILGGINSGKTFTCVNEIIQSAENKDKTILYIVPEQFSMQSQKNILSKMKNCVSMNIRVFGFKHFAYYLLSKCGSMNKVVLDNIDKAILLKKAAYSLKRNGKEKLYYNKVMENQGFLDKLGTLITEFSQYQISSDDLSDFALSIENEKGEISGLNDDFVGKIKSISALYNEYSNLLEGFVSADGILDILYEILSSDELRPKALDNAYVWIDAFNGFTPQEYKIIEALYKYTNDVNIAFTVDTPKTYYEKIDLLEPYYEIKKCINRLTEMAGTKNVKMSVVSQDENTKTPELEYLGKNFLNHFPEPYRDNVNNIEIVEANNKYDEIENLCYSIREMVMNKGYKYGEIGIITCDDSYNIPLCYGLKKYDIPNFLDSRINITNHILPVFILSAIEIINTNWSPKAVFDYLKTGLVTFITPDSTATLENYVLEHGVTYSWEKPWEYGFKNKSDEFKKLINTHRENVYNSLKVLLDIKPSKKYSIKEISVKIFEFLESSNIQNKLNTATRNKTIEQQELNHQVWNTVTNVFEKMVDNLGDEEVNLKEFYALLTAGLSTATAGMVPPTQDSLVIGDMVRTRLPKIRALFILGANEGFLPKTNSDTALITDKERAKIAEVSAYKIVTAPNIISKINQELLNIYFAITKPDDYLYISYSLNALPSKGDLLPSDIVLKIKNIFPEIKTTKALENIKFVNDLNAKRPAFEYLIDTISGNGELNDNEKNLYKYFALNNQPYSEEIKTLLSTVSATDTNCLSEESMDKLLRGDVDVVKKLNLSVSKLETYSSCPFKYFLKHLLDLKERAVYSLDSMDYGNIYHSVTKKVLRNNYKELSENLPSILKDYSEVTDYENYTKDYKNTYTQYKNFVSKFVEKYTDEYTKQELDKDNFTTSFTALESLNRVKKIATDYIVATTTQIETSLFKPFDFEVKFGKDGTFPPIEIPIKDNISINFTGQIDRVDIYDDDDTAYVKIVDYKSKDREKIEPTDSHKLTTDKIDNMLLMQLPTYLSAFVDFLNQYFDNKIALNTEDKDTAIKYKKLKSSHHKVQPAAMLYSEIFKPISSDSFKNKNLANKRAYYYGAEGIFLDSMKVALDLRNKDTEKNNFYNIKYLNPDIKSDKNYSVSISDEDEFQAVLDSNANNLKKLGEDIINGLIPICPFIQNKNDSNTSACKYCPYSEICKKDIKEINIREFVKKD